MREQPAQIQNVIIGPTELFVDVLCKPPQHDEHTKGYRFHQFMADCKIRHARVREGAQLIIAARNARMDALNAELAQLAAE